jgi:hypothetical protein
MMIIVITILMIKMITTTIMTIIITIIIAIHRIGPIQYTSRMMAIVICK